MLIAGIMLGQTFQILSSSLNVIIDTLVGIWLMKYDPLIGRIQAWLLNTCCQSCAENPQCVGQCGGGMSCLMPFVYSCIMTLLLSVLLGGTIQQLSVEFRIITTA